MKNTAFRNWIGKIPRNHPERGVAGRFVRSIRNIAKKRGLTEMQVVAEIRDYILSRGGWSQS